MRFTRTEEQVMFAEGARRLLAEMSSPDRLRQLLEQNAEWDSKLWAALAELGALGAAIPEDAGGLGLGMAEVCVVAEEIGRANAAIPFHSTLVAAEAIARMGSEGQKADWLPKIATGEAIGCVALEDNSEPLAFDGARLNGSVPVVADAGIANFAIVEVGEKLVLVVPRNFELTKLTGFDQLRGYYRMLFTDADAVALPGSDEVSVKALRDRSAVIAAYEAIGGTDACIEMARDYAMERQIFGRPLASYQAIKHKLADIKAARELAYSAACDAAFVADNDARSLAAAASTARLTAIAAFEPAARENQQIHGGIGYTWEANCHFYYRRERAHAAMLGGREYWAERLVSHRPAEVSSHDQTSLDSDSEAGFRREVREWLVANAPEFVRPRGEEWDDATEAGMGRKWQSRLAQGGYGSILLPKKLGGRGGTLNEALIFMEEEASFRLPKGPYVGIGLKMALPVIAKHGSPEQIDRFTKPTLDGELLWCQLFSEPSAGSDLAALRTRAVRDGDEWIVNGQKVWSSWAHHSDWAILIARTDPTVAKHAGLTFFVLDMKTPGIEVRPIRQISGASDFNETFLTDVRIPDSCRIGEVGEGWACAMTVLMGERLGAGAEADPDGGVRGLVTLAVNNGSLGSAYNRTKLGEMLAQELAGEHLTARLREMIAHGDDPGALGGAVKLSAANRMQQSSGFAIEMLGTQGIAHDPDDISLSNAWHDYIWAVALRVAGGADEVLRNQIAERVLGMPGEMRADKGVAFQDLK